MNWLCEWPNLPHPSILEYDLEPSVAVTKAVLPIVNVMVKSDLIPFFHTEPNTIFALRTFSFDLRHKR